MKRAIALLLMISTLLCLTACSSSAVRASQTESIQYTQSVQEKNLLSNLERDTGNGGKEKGVNLFRVYSENGTQYYESFGEYSLYYEECLYKCPIYGIDSGYVVNLYRGREEGKVDSITLNRETDQLALVDSTYVKCEPVIESGYMFPYYVKLYRNGEKWYLQGVGGKENLGYSSHYIEECDGIEVSDADITFTTWPGKYSSVVIWLANYGEQHTVGWWSSTDWNEEKITANLNYYIALNGSTNYQLRDEILEASPFEYNDIQYEGDFTVSLPITKTKNGYFLADITSLEPGMYLFWSYSSQTATPVNIV